MSTAQKILNLLNRESLRVSELAAKLGISRNSAHVQVAKLKATGAVESVDSEKEARVGKPASRYRTVARHEDDFSSAHKPVLATLLEVAGEQLPERERLQLFEEAGSRLARASGLAPTEDFERDFQRAIDAVNELGAMAEPGDSENGPTLRCFTCPIATVVHREPSACSLVASFFSTATGVPVTVRCRHEGTVVCGFSFGERSG